MTSKLNDDSTAIIFAENKLKLTARNVLKGKVIEIVKGAKNRSNMCFCY